MPAPPYDEPPVDANNTIHHALVLLHRLTRAPVGLVAAVLVILAAGVGGAWAAAGFPWAWWAGSIYLVSALIDWGWLSALPRSEISFGPVEPPLFGLALVRIGISMAALVGAALGLPVGAALVIGAAMQVAVTGGVVYGTRLEPFRLGVSHLQLDTNKLPAGQRVRLVQLSDLHVERVTRRERDMLAQVRALDADYVLLTGDYLNFSYVGEPRAIAETRRVLQGLAAREGIYAVRGTHQVDPNAVMEQLFEGLPVRWLRSEHVLVGRDGCRLAIAGASCTRQREIDLPAVRRALDQVPGDAYTVLLYHSPELAAEAASMDADLYLSGHTHGGQIRVPFYGAMVTATDTKKRWEMGSYRVGEMTLYVSRGLGMEGMAAPRVRFLCPPEIVCIDLVGAGAR